MTAFRATFSDMKLVKTRQVAQLIFEIPVEDFDQAYEILGGVPVPGKERWFGIAALKAPRAEEARPAPRQDTQPQPDGAKGKMDWRDMQPAAQAAIRCGDAAFRAYLMEEHSFRPRTGSDETEEAAEFIRGFFGINSRSELSSDHRKRVLWHQLDSAYQAWKQVEHA